MVSVHGLFSEPAKLFLQWRLFQSQSLFIDPCGDVVNQWDVWMSMFAFFYSKAVSMLWQLSAWFLSAPTGLESGLSLQGRRVRGEKSEGLVCQGLVDSSGRRVWMLGLFLLWGISMEIKVNLLFLDHSSLSCDFWKYETWENLGQAVFEVVSDFLDVWALKLLSVSKVSLCFTSPCWTMPVN